MGVVYYDFMRLAIFKSRLGHKFHRWGELELKALFFKKYVDYIKVMSGRKVRIVSSKDASTQVDFAMLVKPGYFRSDLDYGPFNEYPGEAKERRQMAMLEANATNFTAVEFLLEWSAIYGYTAENTLMSSDSLYKKVIKKWRLLTQDTKFIWLTLAPSKVIKWKGSHGCPNVDNEESRRILPTEENIKRVKAMLNTIKKKYWDEYLVVIEGGKGGDHLHVHALVKVKRDPKDSSKIKSGHARYIENLWGATFYEHGDKKQGALLGEKSKDPEYYKKEWNESPNMPSYEEWLQEKVVYCDNSLKGDHSNREEIINAMISSKFFTSRFKNSYPDFYEM